MENLARFVPTICPVTRDRYVFIYPTPEAERKKGYLRVVSVSRLDQLARLERLREKGY